MNEGALIANSVVGLFLMFAIPFVAGGLYLLFSGQLKLFFLLLTVLSVIVGHFVLSYYMNSDPSALATAVHSYGKWFFNHR